MQYKVDGATEMKNIQHVYTLIMGSFSVLLWTVSSWFATAQAADPGDISRLQALETSLQAIMKENNVPGVQGVIVTKDKIVWKGHLGVSDVEMKKAVTPSTLFRIGSISKSITSLAILKAVEKGKISLDMDIEKELPEVGVSNRWKKENPVLLKHVLEHTAGFDDIHPRDYAFSDPDAKLLDGILFNNGSRSARWQPGTRMSYSNMGPALGGLALEKATGETFEDYVQREVFDTLEMKTATFHYDPAVSKSYNPDGQVSPYVHIGVRPSGAASLTTSDMAQFVQMFLNRGAVNDEVFLPSELITRMEISTSTLSAKKGLKTGYGLGNAVTQRDGYVYHGHTGGIDGFLSSYDYLPAHNVGFFFSMNSNNEKAFLAIMEALHEFVTKDLPAGEKPAPVSLNSAEIDAITGIYKPVSTRWQLTRAIELFFNMKRVRATEGGITLSNILDESEAEELVSVGGQIYRQKEDVQPSMMFHERQDEKHLLQSMRGTFEKVSLFSVILRWASAVLILVLTLTCWGYACVWGLQMARKRFNYERNALVRVIPFLTTILIPFCVFLLVSTMGDISSVHLPGFSAVGFWIGTIIFAIMSFVSMIYTGMRWPKRAQIGRFAWLHSMLVGIAMTVTTFYFTYHGFIGLRLWEY